MGITAQKMKCSIKDFFSKCDQIMEKYLRNQNHDMRKRLKIAFILKVGTSSNEH